MNSKIAVMAVISAVGKGGDEPNPITPGRCGDYGDSLLEFSQQRRLPLDVPVHSGLWARFAGCQAPAELPLERRDPFRRAKRPSDRGCRLDPSRRRGIGRRREKRSKIGDQSA